jgi:hypothetical protein
MEVRLSLYSFCLWLQNTPWGTAIRESTLVFPIIETIHVLALALSVGTVAVFDLRLLGWGLRREPVSQVMSQIMPWSTAGIAVMFVTGWLLFWSQALKAYGSVYFRIKLLLLLLAGVNALVFQVTLYRSMATWDEAEVTPLQARWTGGLSLALWIGIIAAGRTMAYKF